MKLLQYAPAAWFVAWVLAGPCLAQAPDGVATAPGDRFRAWDRDGDGKLSLAEVQRVPALERRLTGADTNQDGFYTPAEIRAHLQPAPAPDNPKPGPDQLGPGDHLRTVAVAGTTRRYQVHVPPSYSAARPTAVVIAYHGGGGNPESMLRLSGLNAKSDAAGFLVVYPYGSGVAPDRFLSFNGGECCGYAKDQRVDDVAFTAALLDDLAAVANVDADRVFATGISNGGIMAHYVASELSDRIAAIAPVAGPLMLEAVHASHPVSVIHFHGTADELAPFAGGFGKGPGGGRGVTEFRSVRHTVQAWIDANGCASAPQVEPLPDRADDGMRVTRTTWRGGKQGSEVVLIEVEGGGHTWPGMKPLVPMLGKSTEDISANDLMWEFFERHPRSRAAATTPTGMRVLRTPEERYAQLPGYEFAPHYVTVDDFEGGSLRMHYVDEGPREGPAVLMLHGNPTWSYLFREVVRPMNAAGYRTILLDYVGMGRSDKPADFDDYSYDRHLGWVRQAFAQLDADLGLKRVSIFGHDYGVPLGIRLMHEHYPDRFDAFVAANASLPVGDHIAPTHLRWRQFVREHPDVPIGQVVSSRVDPPLSDAEIAAYNAPYPDARYKMALRSFPEMVPDSPERPEAVANLAAWRYLEGFTRPFMTIFGKFDAVAIPSARSAYIERVPGAWGQPQLQLDVSHYAPEDRPEDVARAVIAWLDEVYSPVPFTCVARAKFAEGLSGFVSGGPAAAYDPQRGAVTLTGDEGDASSVEQAAAMDLRQADALKVAVRYLPEGLRDGDRVFVELWDGAGWSPLLTHVCGVDCRDGADDYAWVRVDSHQAKFCEQSRVRVRCAARGPRAGVRILDLAIYVRQKSALDSTAAER